MKTAKLFAACLLLAFTTTTHAQWVSIPDVKFGNWLFYNGYNQCLQGDSIVGWEMDTTCYAVETDYYLTITGQDIQDFTGIEYFDNLGFFDCRNNKLATLPALPPNLATLDCSSQDYLTVPFDISMAVLPEALTSFTCSYNNLSELPPLPAGLLELTCKGNQFITLPTLPAGLVSLKCGETITLNTLPALPASLNYLDCSGMDSLYYLPVLPAGLVTLNCRYNYNLMGIQALPNGLRELWAYSSNLFDLPTLPDSLWDLEIGGNFISVLPSLPPTLRYLTMAGNPVSVIPDLPATLTKLDVASSNITTLPELPDSLELLDADNCTNLTCLPQLKIVKQLKLNNTNVTCLPNYPLKNDLSTPPFNSIPLCSYFNSNGCPIYWNITGKVYEDANANCISDSSENGTNAVKVQLWQNGSLIQQTVPSQGFYSFDVSTYGTYQITVDTTTTPFRIKCPSSGSFTVVISSTDSMDYSLDFALECKPGFDLEAKSIATNTIFRPANFNTIEVAAGDASNFYNGHCAAGTSGTVTLSFTGPVKYTAPAGGALTPTVAGNTLTYNIANFGAVNFFEDFDIITQTDTTAQANQQICFTLSVTPTSGDNNPANNTFNVCYTVVNSFDPNDKAVYPEGNIDTAQRDLVYTIRFQNTGNAEAQHIYITDTLSSSINPASFQLLAYSHAPMVQLDGNKLRFNFPNINLPDSTTNEPASHGYVQFKVKLNNGLPVGTVINNTAYIYFDFNAPVVTNTTTNTIYIPAPPVLKPVSIGKYRIDRGVKPNGKL